MRNGDNGDGRAKNQGRRIEAVIAEDGLGLFLDVDLTLTLEPIQKTYAAILGFEAPYLELEEGLGAGTITEQEFGRRMCELLNLAGASPKSLGLLARQVRLRRGADALLRSVQNVHLVSSGPDYYIKALAKRYRIAPDRVFCSQYVFDAKPGRFIACMSVVGDFKKRYVEGEVGKYQVTIGVGDDPERDAGFMSACKLGIGYGPRWKGLCTSDLTQVVAMVRALRRFGKWCAAANGWSRLEMELTESSPAPVALHRPAHRV